MNSRKQKIVQSVNLLSEQRYLYNKFIKEDVEETEIPKLQVTPIEGKVEKYKISLFQKQPNDNLKDIMTDELLEKLKLKKEYASQESATIDVNKVTPQQLKDINNEQGTN
jgi:hypothetical protein